MEKVEKTLSDMGYKHPCNEDNRNTSVYKNYDENKNVLYKSKNFV